LIGSSVAIYFADKGIKAGKQKQLKVCQALAMLFGLVFLTLKVVEYSGYDYNWATHAYGSITWTMTGFHSAHVISVFLKGMVVLAMALRGMFTPERHVAVEINGLYWHFVVVIWLPLYFTMYISPWL
jgi:cytochrome c oxidase subunit III